MSKDLFRRYIWLVDVIYSNKKITFQEISDKWQRNENLSDGKPLALRTFHNHRNQIEEIFDLNIECDKSSNQYYIENADEIKSNSIRRWLLDTFTVNNLVNESQRLKDRILFENIPSGRAYLAPIIETMRDSLTIEITYQSYFKDKEATFELEPYALKVFKQRWYVIGHCPSYNEIRIYALDRIKELKATSKSFSYPKEDEFDLQDFFDDYFGVIVDHTIKPQHIKIKAFDKQRNYLRDLPLHQSQKEIEEKDYFSVFEYRLCPTYDFYQEILSLGSHVQILEPQSVKEHIAQEIKKTQSLYSK